MAERLVPPSGGGPPAGAPPMVPLTERPTLAENLSIDTLERIVNKLGLKELKADDGGPYKKMKCPAGPFKDKEVCILRVFNGPGISKLVYNQLILEEMGLDAHMIFAFSEKNSAVPHFTLDAIRTQSMVPYGNAFHIDLIPRVDLGANLTYMDEVYGPLTPVRKAFIADEGDGLKKAALSNRQLAIMSPWMLANQARDPTYINLQAVVNEFADRWLDMIQTGLSIECTESIRGVDLESRDKKHRAALFSPDVDPVWAQVDRMIGKEASEEIQDLLKDPDMLVSQ